MSRLMNRSILAGVLLLATVPAWAQQSASYKQEEHSLNAGGTPMGGASPGSSSYRIGLSSLGDDPSLAAATSASFILQGGFVGSHPAPGEVTNLHFISETVLEWDPDPAVGFYNIYRDMIGNLSGLGFGNCQQPMVTAPTAMDTDPLSAGSAYFYLVTAENTLNQEGIKGYRGDGTLRLGTTCP